MIIESQTVSTQKQKIKLHGGKQNGAQLITCF